MTQKVESHATAIKKLEHQFGQISVSMNQRKLGTLPNNTVEDPKNDSHVFAITTRSGMTNIDPSLPAVVVAVDETPIVESEKKIGGDDVIAKKRGKGLSVEQNIRQIPRPPPPFPQ